MSVPTIIHAESFAWTQELARDAGSYYSFHTAFGGRHFWEVGTGRGVPAGASMWAVWNSAIEGYTLPVGRTQLGVALAFCQGNSWWDSSSYYGNSYMLDFWDENPDFTGTFVGNVGQVIPGGGGLAHRFCSLETDASGHFVCRNAAGAVIATSTVVMPPGRQSYPLNYSHLEILLDTVAQTIAVRMDGDDVLTVSSAGMGSGSINHVRLICNDGRHAADYVIHEGTDFIGDVRVAYFPANASGTYSAGTIVGGTTLLDCVDDPLADADTTFISLDDTSLPKAASFGTTNLPSNVTSVVAVIPHALVRKDDAGANKGRLLLISGASEQDGGADLTVSTAWNAYTRVHMTNPNTGLAWTISEANAVEVGWRRTV